MLIFVFSGIIVFLTISPFILSWFNRGFLKNVFKKNNVIVFGKKGTGKDLLFQAVVNDYRCETYSNIKYNKKSKLINLKDLELKNNTFDNFVDGSISQEVKNDDFEGKDFFISDIGVMLPSQYDTKLYKYYPSFAIFYALSRHLYNSNIHCNTQNLSRVWKALREQADFYIKCIEVKKPFILGLFGFLRIDFICYDKYESANNSLLPLSGSLFNKYLDANYKQYYATNGLIEKKYILVHKSEIKYNTRAFHEKIFGYKYQNKKSGFFSTLNNRLLKYIRQLKDKIRFKK